MFYLINLRKSYKKILLILFISFLLIFLIFINYITPLKYIDIIKKYSKQYEVSEDLICAIINTESRFEPNAVSIKGASGLMQLLESTANWLAEKENIQNFDFKTHIFEPDINLRLGVAYISELIEKYNGNYDLALASYNAGTGNVAKWLSDYKYSKDGESLDSIPFKETRNYIKKIKIFKFIYKIKLEILDALKFTKEEK